MYSAAGTLLQKTSSDTKTGLKTITTYIAGFVYERRIAIAASGGTDTLQYTLHEEGRIRYTVQPAGFVYDYFLKDHLGNIRTTLTEQQRVDAYPVASLETVPLNNEKLYYSNLDIGRTDKNTVSGYPVDTRTNPNNYTQKLTGGTGTKMGAGILLKVMAGDKLTVYASSWYSTAATPGTAVSPLTDIVGALTNSLPGISGNKLVQSQLTSTVLNPSVTGFLNTRDAGGVGTKPKAWFNVVLLDEQLNPVITNDGRNSFFEQVGTSGQLKPHSITDRPVTKNGYVYIYVSNETPNINVYFDTLQVTHTRGALLSESAFYPFGLEAKGICSQAGTTTANNYKFNAGTELEERFDIDLYETPFRRYDAQIGRFTGVEVLAEKTIDLSPYQFGGNNPVMFNDPTGLLVDGAGVSVNNRMKKGPDGNYHTGWVNEMLWNDLGFYDWGESGGGSDKIGRGGGGGGYKVAGGYSFSGDAAQNVFSGIQNAYNNPDAD